MASGVLEPAGIGSQADHVCISLCSVPSSSQLGVGFSGSIYTMVIGRGCKSGYCLSESQLLSTARFGDTACNPSSHETGRIITMS